MEILLWKHHTVLTLLQFLHMSPPNKAFLRVLNLIWILEMRKVAVLSNLSMVQHTWMVAVLRISFG